MLTQAQPGAHIKRHLRRSALLSIHGLFHNVARALLIGYCHQSHRPEPSPEFILGIVYSPDSIRKVKISLK